MTIYHKSVHDGSDLVAPTVLSGIEKLGLAYTSSAENIANFDIDKMPANATGVFTHGAQTVTYLYRRKDAVDVNVRYLDVHGNSIESDDTISGVNKLGLNYITSPINVEYIYKRQRAFCQVPFYVYE
ncbi:MucBP domain-containing protein [Lachnoanaerobaculum sp. OBRC5-5]|uniref:MucBP domain-containing protein n=1 Tax=Lachnoanaerobaculum sp. OBRC5-5 TaxID=936595 RepID=UPI0002824FB9|nr:MucBP domain-containing protein [Lachnoanaerobaculum sp. OBRC5-5]EJZ69435.1 hypothetical protein HMPREF1135_01986 [Lachnoanaerobaculum sp. OBRC5-5]